MNTNLLKTLIKKSLSKSSKKEKEASLMIVGWTRNLYFGESLANQISATLNRIQKLQRGIKGFKASGLRVMNAGFVEGGDTFSQWP